MRTNFFFKIWWEKGWKEKLYGKKKGMSMLIVIDNIVDPKLIKTKTNYKYLIGYLDEVIRPLILVLPKMSGYFKTWRRWK